MHKSRKNTLIIDGIVGIMIAIFVVQCAIPLYDVNTASYEDPSKINLPLSDDDPISQDDFSLLELPYYTNLTGLENWLKKNIIDGKTDITTGYLFYGLTNRNGSEVIDNNHYFEDYLVYLDGLCDIIGLNEVSMISAFKLLVDSKFYDTVSPNGYYSFIDQNRSTNSGIKEFDDNVQILLTFADWAISSFYTGELYGLETSLANAWTQLEANFLDSRFSDRISFNHTTNNTEKYIRDQLMGAIAGFQLARADRISNDAVRNTANLTATKIMERIMNNGTANIFQNNNSFQFKRDSNYETVEAGVGSDFNELETNAYGIWALCEYYLQSNKKVQNALGKSENVYNFLEMMWNGTAKLYSTNTTIGEIKNHNMTLKDNGIMISALVKLFEITGNITYFNRIMEIVQGIRTKLYDQVYGNYFTSYDPINDLVDEQKSFKAHSYLFRGFGNIAELSRYLSTNITLNSTTIIKNVNCAQNITMKILMKSIMNYTLPGNNLIYYTKDIYLENSTFFTSVRYPNGTVFYTNSLIGSATGNASVVVPLNEQMPNGAYSIAMYVNYTGFVTQFNFSNFNYISGLNMKAYEWSSSKMYPGETYILNLTVNSTRSDVFNNSFAIIKGDILSSDINESIIIENGTVKNILINIPVKALAKFEQSSMNISFYRNNVMYDNYTISVEILSPIEVIHITQDEFGFPAYEFDAEIFLRNLVSYPINCSLILSSDIFENTNTKTIQILAKSVLAVKLNVTIDNSTTIGQKLYAINISRSIDSEEILSQNFNLEIKNKFEIISMSLPAKNIHWNQIYTQIIIKNNLLVNKPISIQVDGKVIDSTFILIPGVNVINVPLELLLNPYFIGSKQYEIAIFDYNSDLLYQDMVSTSVSISIGSLLVGYIIPLIIPLIGIVVFKHKELENKKRLI